ILRDPGEERGLRKRQPLRVVPEVGPRRALDAVRAVAEVNGVQVTREDAVLRPALLDLPREGRLLQLARQRALARDVRVLDELLRDRRAALDDLPVRDVGPERATDAAQVEAPVLVEALVL